jgi:hypothetical protein
LEEAVRRAAPECERAEVIAGCALLVVRLEIVVGPNLDVLDARIKSRFGVT